MIWKYSESYIHHGLYALFEKDVQENFAPHKRVSNSQMEYVGNVYFQTRVCKFTCSVLCKFLAIRKDKIWEKQHSRSLSFNPALSSHFPSVVEIASGKCTCIRMHPGRTGERNLHDRIIMEKLLIDLS